MISSMLFIAILVAFFIISFIFRKIFKWFFIISFIISLALAIVAFMVFTDFTNLKQFPDKTNLFLLDDSGEITLAGQVNLNQTSTTPMSEEETQQIANFYSQRDYEAIKSDNFKVLIFNKDYLLPPDEQGSSEPQNQTKKFEAFLSSISNTYQQKDEQLATSSLIKAFKEGKVKIYPETIIFKLLKVLPVESLINLAGLK